MITIYTSKGVTCLPYELIGENVEDFRVRLLYINFMHWLAGEALSLFEKPIKLIAILCLWWPVNLYG